MAVVPATGLQPWSSLVPIRPQVRQKVRIVSREAEAAEAEEPGVRKPW